MPGASAAMIYTRSLDDLGGGDVALAGGKATALGEMRRAGLPVPPGYVVLTTAFNEQIRKFTLSVDPQPVAALDTAAIGRWCESMEAMFLQTPMSSAMIQQIETSFRGLMAKRVAVRSSATFEDSSAHSWAGQLDTYLSTAESELLTNIRRCWASLYTPRALAYREARGLLAQQGAVAVVVQAMIDAEVSGTAFSAHPVHRDLSQIVIEAGYGLGEAVVSGRITPDTYIVGKQPRRIEQVSVSVQSEGLYAETDGRCDWKKLPVALLGRQKLSADRILELADMIMAIETYYGRSCDIEWAFDNERFYIMQSRPLTALGESAGR